MKYSLFFTLLFTLLCTSVRAQCPAGNVVIETDAELASFLTAFPACTELNGDLNLQGNVTTTSGLEGITYIKGSLTIRQTPIKDLDGLNGLVQIDGDFGMNQVNFQGDVANVSLALKNIGGQLVISQNADLEAINALENLTSIDEVLITLNPILVELGGLETAAIASKLTITDNASLSNCDAGGVCAALSLPAADLNISSNNNGCNNYYQVLAACTGAPCPPDINVTTNQEIIDITTAFPNCVNLPGNLTVSENATQIFRFSIENVAGNVVFFNLDYSDFDQLGIETIGGNFEIISLPNLISTFANGPLPLQSVGGTVRLQNLQSVENVAAFQNITTIGGLWILACDQLDEAADFSPWQGTTFTGGRLILDSNPNIESLDFLSPLDLDGAVFERIQIIGLSQIEDISTLAAAASVDTLIIALNPLLEDCSIAPICDAIANPAASLLFQNNATGCNTQSEVKSDCFPDLSALLDFYNATDGPNWGDNIGWVDGASGTNCTPCDGTWRGVTCNPNGRVTTIDLVSNNLTGTLPTSINQLSWLEILSLGFNDLTGALPNELFTMPRLERIFCRTNNFTGGIPAGIGAAPALETIVISNNPNLGGSIPAELTDLASLIFMAAADCGLTGPLPIINDGDLPGLRWLIVDENNLSGNFSANYGFLTQLERIELNDNNFTGIVPSIFAFLPNLRTFHIENNGFVNGLPTNLNAATSLEEFKVGNNNLDGSLRPNLRDLVNLEIFEVSQNSFTGEAPALDQSPNLVIYNVADNNLDGVVPDALLNATMLEEILLNDNAFTGPLPLFPANSTGTLVEFNAANNNFAGCYPAEYEDLCSVFTDFSNNSGLPDGGSPASFTADFCQGNDACGALPVNWLGITAEVDGKVVRLNWETATELNNEGFRIERSASGREWGAIGTVSAGGNAYEFIDEAPLAGTGFYRVRQINFNGASSLSQVATVRFSSAADLVYPNPFKDQLTVYNAEPDQVVVYDANGREVLRYAHLGGGAQVQRVVLKSGVYTLRLRSSGKVTRIVAH